MTRTSDETSGRDAGDGAEAPIISVENVSRWFGDVAALDGVSLDVRTGEVLAVLGENGAGKTTLMRILGGLDSPNGGRVLLRGKPYEPRSPKDAVHAGIALVLKNKFINIIWAIVPPISSRLLKSKSASAGAVILAPQSGWKPRMKRPITSVNFSLAISNWTLA